MFKQVRFVFILILALMSATVSGQSNSVAGKVVFATGNTTAINTSGSQRGLQRGNDVFAGDTLRTGGNSRLQVSFVDGAYISVQPDSEYKIKEYEYSGQPDGSESAVYRLIKGGIRAVTGLIGKEKPEAYKVETAAATIGVRGTGHNTRICQGDCPGKQNGLYHNTWEGVTYVFNNAESVDVPSGRGVYVRNMNTPIRFLSQASGVTALDLTNERREEQREEEDETRLVTAGDRRNEDGQQSIVVSDTSIIPTSSRVLLDQSLAGISQDATEDNTERRGFLGSDVSVFANDTGFVGVLMTENDDGEIFRTLGTIDPAAVLGGDDPDSVAEAQALLSTVGAGDLARFQDNPASAVESVVNTASFIGWGRWSGGNVLTVNDTGETTVRPLSGNQSVHFVFGPEPDAPIPQTGFAGYGFLGGTQSTSASGATVGQGIVDTNPDPDNVSSYIYLQFFSNSAILNMQVAHDGFIYDVSGDLVIDPGNNLIFNALQGVTAEVISGTVPGGSCNSAPGCFTTIEGGFVGPTTQVGPDNVPTSLGIQYQIQETDPINGVGAFSTTISVPM